MNYGEGMDPLLKKYGFENEKFEVTSGQFAKTGYPKPIAHHTLVLENTFLNMENTYFWLLNMYKRDMKFTDVEKIQDLMSASQQSSFWGASQQRLGITQQKAQEIIMALGKLIGQDLFQMVRELRQINERLEYFHNSDSKDKDVAKASEIALKSIYMDQVEGGGQKAGSIIQLSMQVGFNTLPQLFNLISPKKIEDVVKLVEKNSMAGTRTLKDVLIRKLTAYVNWKTKVWAELEQRKKFQLKFLRQHYNVIKLYLQWITPYLKSAKKLQMQDKHLNSIDMVGAFEGAIIEVELMGIKKNKGPYRGVIITTLKYRVKPSLSMQTAPDQYQHKGPIHFGEMTMDNRSYVWTQEQIDKYKQMKDEEGFKLLGEINKSYLETMDALDEDLKKYLTEAGEVFPEDEEAKKLKENEEKKQKEKLKKEQSMFSPFLSLGGGFKELFGGLIPDVKHKKKGELNKYDLEKSKKDAKSAVSGVFLIHHFFKKGHRNLAW